MKCVSYTRTTTCYKKDDPVVHSIVKQNKHITEYARAHKLRITKKYTDRKNDSNDIESFEKMRNDGINRRFDLIIFDSVWQFGKDVFSAVRVLQDSFYPAGINFACVQEDFCSLYHTKSEVYAWLDGIWSRYRSHLAEVRESKQTRYYHLNTFGYYYDSENDCLKIDEDSAAVVREVFEKLKDGKTPGEISRELNERSIEKPGDYRSRLNGWELKGTNREWDEGTVSTIAKNQKYTGRWEKYINGRNYAEDCEPIVDPDLFDEVQKILAGRRHHRCECFKPNNPFQKMMTDEETGAKVIMKRSAYTGEYDFHFKPRKPKGVKYDRTCMDYQEAIDQMRTCLRQERDKAQAAVKVIADDSVRSHMRFLLDEEKKPLRGLFPKFMEKSGSRLFLYTAYSSGRINEKDYNKLLTELDAEIACITNAMRDIYDRVSEIEMIYSMDNPWIKLFLQYDEKQELTRSYVSKFCEHVHIWRFEEIRPVFRDTWWRDRIPFYMAEV